MRKTIAIAVAGVAVVSLSACREKDREPFRDAPRTSDRNRAPAQIIEMPDGFSNLASKCDGPNRIYVAFKAEANRAAVAVVAGDPRCAPR